MELNNKIIDKVWCKAEIIPFESPALYRRDSHGRVIYRFSYALYSGRGWDVGNTLSGTDEHATDVDQLEPLHWESLQERADRTRHTPPVAKLG